MIITELTREHSPSRLRRHQPANCFFCSSRVGMDGVHVAGATAEVWLHMRCAEELGLGLLRAADWRRRPSHPGLGAIA